MAIGFIPNQPILFTSDTQLCKNSDSKQYAQLLQQDDTLCVQFNNNPCGDNLFSCEMENLIANPDFSSGAGWTLETGWTISGGTLNGGAGSAGNKAFTSATLIAGSHYMVTFTVSGYVSGSVHFILGDGAGQSAGTDRAANGTFTQVVRYTDSEQVFQFGTGVGVDFVGSVDSVYLAQLCFNADDLDNETDWAYDTVSGNYTHIAGVNELWQNGAPEALTGVPYQVTVQIINMQAGSVEAAWIYASDSTVHTFGTPITGNGTYVFYSTPGLDSTIAFVPTTDFDGTVVTSSIIIKEMSYGHTIKLIDSDGNVASETINASTDNPIVYSEDWMTWCADWDTIESFDVPGTMVSSGCYTIRVLDDCTSTNYDSTTVVSYLKTGTHDCTKMIEATCSQYGFGFNFGVGNFTLNQRLAILRISPKYPSDQDTYIYSTGRHKRTFAQSEKIWTMWVRKIDEWAHDALRTQLICDTLTIDGIEYFCPADSYEPEWTENMNQNLAAARIDLQKVQDVIFNKNL